MMTLGLADLAQQPPRRLQRKQRRIPGQHSWILARDVIEDGRLRSRFWCIHCTAICETAQALPSHSQTEIYNGVRLRPHAPRPRCQP